MLETKFGGDQLLLILLLFLLSSKRVLKKELGFFFFFCKTAIYRLFRSVFQNYIYNGCSKLRLLNLKVDAGNFTNEKFALYKLKCLKNEKY